MSWWMAVILFVYLILCFWLIFVILIQSGKGGGLSSLGGASEGLSEALGATGAEKTLNKLTTLSAVGFMVLAIVLAVGGRFSNQPEEFLGAGEQAAPLAQVDTSSTGAVPVGQSATELPDDVMVPASPVEEAPSAEVPAAE